MLLKNLLNNEKSTIMKKALYSTLFVFLMLFLNSCDSSEPTLCDCLTKSEFAEYGSSKAKQCEKIFIERYGVNPSTYTGDIPMMTNDYYSCKN